MNPSLIRACHQSVFFANIRRRSDAGFRPSS